MKVGFRKPNIEKSLKAKTTGRAKRTLKKSVNPLYGKKGMGYINNPSKAVYNKIYSQTSIDPLAGFKESFDTFDATMKEASKIDIKWKDDEGNIINISNESILFKDKNGKVSKLINESLKDIEIIDNDFLVYGKEDKEKPFIKIGIPKNAENKVNQFINITTGNYDDRTVSDRIDNGLELSYNIFTLIKALISLAFWLCIIAVFIYMIYKSIIS